ncbi:iron chaperone [Listeria grandensis]|uniref:iron chaperone n=1 Tax=Listeria grandensis TaxID=1494963 RepID=UPI00164E6660|nr:DUF1801 domain-containing protein [Listeria grandensis]MBC6316949.1 DUF1801 domain-containing protein [Listeria grandensis]
MVETVDQYIACLETEEQHKWTMTFVAFMRENYPDFEEKISCQMPTFKFGQQYIAFSNAKTHFSVHTLDFELVLEMKNRLPRAKFGKGCVKVKFEDDDAIPELFKFCREIVVRNQIGM